MSATPGLVGRERAVEELRTLLEPDGRLVTVTGLPGVGKSSLAAAVLAGTQTEVVEVTMDADPEVVGDAVVSALGAALAHTPVEALWEAFGGEPVTVLLDGLRRSTSAAGVVTELVAGYPRLCILATAPHPLQVEGERVLRLDPLPLPGSDADDDHPAVQLFLDRARSADPRFDSTVERVHVREICRLTGGVPLAVELAAARLATMPAEIVARALARRSGIEVLEGADRSVSAALGFGYDALEAPVRRTLDQLAVFEAPFLLDAAATVVAPPRGPAELLDVLSELVGAHLLDHLRAEDGEPPRFRVPGLVRAYVLHRRPADAELRLRHARYFRVRCRAGAEVVRREWPDVVAMLDHALSTADVDDALVAAVAAAPAVRDRPAASASLAPRLAGMLAGSTDVVARARALVWSAALHPGGEVEEDLTAFGLWTAERLATATADARAVGDSAALLEALEMTVRSLNVTLDIAAAVAAAHEGRELATRVGDQASLARFEGWVSMAERQRGAETEAVSLAASAFERGRSHGDALATINAALLLHRMPAELRPELSAPLPSLPELLEECRSADLAFTAITVTAALAGEALAAGDLAGAARWSWRQLLLAADRIRSEPLTSVGAVVCAVPVVVGLGDVTGAIRLRESVRSFEPLLDSGIIPPPMAHAYQALTDRLEASVGPEQYAELAAEVSGLRLLEANRLAQAVVRALVTSAPSTPAAPAVALTPRERDVLRALASGATNAQIAERLGLTTKTVMHHSVAIYRKLGVRGRAAATAWAFRHGLAEVGPL